MDDELLTAPDPTALGLPEELPPVKLPNDSVLARNSRSSPLLARVHELTTWLGDREVVAEDFELCAADIAVATDALGCSRTELDLLWNLAADLDFVELNESDARPGTGLEKWREGTDEAALDVWDVALEFILTESATSTRQPGDFVVTPQGQSPEARDRQQPSRGACRR